MLEEHIDAYYVPSGDYHGSEFTADHFKMCEFLSGFTGEAADMLITRDAAHLWTDGRFFIQAEQELKGSDIELMKSGEEGVPSVSDFIKDDAKGKGCYTLGFDGRVVMNAFTAGLDGIDIKWDLDLGGDIWKERPHLAANRIWELPTRICGECSASKIVRIRASMREESADYLVLTDLGEIAWLLNLRGSDIDYTPVFYSFLILSKESVSIYLMDDAIDTGLPGSLREVEGLSIKRYDDFLDDVRSLKGCVHFDPKTASYAFCQSLPKGIKRIEKNTPAGFAKLRKNSSELAGMKKAHIADAEAVIKSIRWLKENAGSPGISESDAAEYIDRKRLELDDCFDLSFDTIAAYGSNAAIVHYTPKRGSDSELKAEGFLLLDSGGQYSFGTTDITRTIALGPLTDRMKRYYTLVLKAHIALSMFRFKDGMDGTEADKAARKPLIDEGLDFNHGISHGVGHVLSVHEGPNAIGRKPCDTEISAGMVMSNEPGLYIEGEFGIRIENLIYIKEAKDGSGEYISEPLTLVPYEREAVDTSLLTEEEREWIDDYHLRVRDALKDVLSGEDLCFLMRETEPLKV